MAPLHFAASNGHLSVIEYLVNQKADVNVKTKDAIRSFFLGLRFIMPQ